MPFITFCIFKNIRKSIRFCLLFVKSNIEIITLLPVKLVILNTGNRYYIEIVY